MASPPGAARLAALLLLALLAGPAASRFAPADNHLIACGATAPAVLPDGRRFVPDSGCASMTLRSAAPALPSAAPAAPAPAPPSPLHAAARVFSCHASYDLAVRRRGRHVLRLHFYPFSPALASARFHVGAGGFLLLHNFTASSPVVKDFLLPVDADVLVLTFVPEAGSAAFVNAIELFSAPEELVGDIATLVAADGVNRTDGLSSQVFETLYRVNVAGRKVTPFNDTLWRTWVNDEGFLVNKESSSSKAWSFGGRIAYPKDSRLMTREVAPDNVYNSARSVRSDGNLTWGFPVPARNRYLVRMHFCDIVSKALYQLYFSIYVNGHLAVKDFDISSTTGYLAYPYYIDYVVDVEDEGMLKLAIGGSKMSRPGEASGFLNGLEIMRMNKTGGGMDGDFPVVLDMGYLVSKGFREFARSLLCGLVFAGLFLVLVMLVLRLRTELKNNGTLWFSQSVDSGEGKLAKAYQLVPTKTDY
ncbi:probable receptor-like protein kinase At5g24010 [Triticum dicoccoides]|uniref:probable receptor-like protein kinase At5g24010 n=1 Tax=Triticum dicoccoides TaxID=85692 RepID=UPI000E7938AE|nr:probable receptor-like protein kinase At5g24010 [Triticum dicoccoides]